MDDLDAARDRVAALAADRLPLARGERGEEIVEVAIALVDEMELLVGALEKAGLAEEAPLGFRQEGDVDRGDAVAAGERRDALGEESCACGRRPGRA